MNYSSRLFVLLLVAILLYYPMTLSTQQKIDGTYQSGSPHENLISFVIEKGSITKLSLNWKLKLDKPCFISSDSSNALEEVGSEDTFYFSEKTAESKPIRIKNNEFTFKSKKLGKGEVILNVNGRIWPTGNFTGSIKFVSIKCNLSSLLMWRADKVNNTEERETENETATASKKSGEKILKDKKLFSPDFVKVLFADPPGQGRIVPSPTPEINVVIAKYGNADQIKLETIKVIDGPTVMIAAHYYGNYVFGVANGRIMVVLKKK